MASGPVCRANRPKTWLHRPAMRREDFPCQLGAVHTWHSSDPARCPTWVRKMGLRIYGMRSRPRFGFGSYDSRHKLHPSFFGQPAKCEVAHISPDGRVRAQYRRPGGEHGTENKLARFVLAVGTASTILAIMTWAMAQPSSSPIYRPELLLLY
jgi:hypothetical protein